MDSRQEPDVPTWARRVASQHEAHAVWHLLNKKVSSSDVHKHQHRLLIGKRDIYDRLLPAISEEEKQAASFLNYPEAGIRRHRRDHLAGGERGPRLVGRNHGGLQVIVCDQRGQGCRLLFTRWEGSGAAVLIDPLTELYAAIVSRKPVTKWSSGLFSTSKNKLCFAVANKAVSSFLSR